MWAEKSNMWLCSSLQQRVDRHKSPVYLRYTFSKTNNQTKSLVYVLSYRLLKLNSTCYDTVSYSHLMLCLQKSSTYGCTKNNLKWLFVYIHTTLMTLCSSSEEL